MYYQLFRFTQGQEGLEYNVVTHLDLSETHKDLDDERTHVKDGSLSCHRRSSVGGTVEILR